MAVQESSVDTQNAPHEKLEKDGKSLKQEKEEEEFIFAKNWRRVAGEKVAKAT